MTETGNREISHKNLAKHVFERFVRQPAEKISQLTEENRVLTKENKTDLVTGLPNEKALFDHVHALNGVWKRSIVESSGESKIKGTAIALDLTGLKKVNDGYGRSMGDFYLKSVADTVRENIREGDQVFRLGTESDEFSLFLPGETDNENINKLLDRFDAKLREKQTKYEDTFPDINFSLSFVAVKYGDDRSPMNAYQKGHDLMGQYKRRKQEESGVRGLSVGRTIIN
jgi:diguanylate cyclase (GGDEF)-like protein